MKFWPMECGQKDGAHWETWLSKAPMWSSTRYSLCAGCQVQENPGSHLSWADLYQLGSLSTPPFPLPSAMLTGLHVAWGVNFYWATSLRLGVYLLHSS